jgi:cold-inducible RNA-binding protein
MAAKLFVGNLSFQATEEDLRELFAQAGNVETVRIITDQFTGRPRGFGFVEMATKEEAQKAVEMLNGRLFRDRNLVVDEARPQPQRGGGGGGGGGPRGDRPRTGGGPGGGGGGWRR